MTAVSYPDLSVSFLLPSCNTINTQTRPLTTMPSFHSEYLLVGESWIQGPILINLYQTLAQPFHGRKTDDRPATDIRNLPSFGHFIAVDPGAGYVLQASIKIPDYNWKLHADAARKSMVALKQQLPHLHLRPVDRLALDPRVKRT